MNLFDTGETLALMPLQWLCTVAVGLNHVLCPEDRPLLARVAEALRLREDDTLGGGGSRGSGRMSLNALTLIWRSKDYYAKGAPEITLLSGADVTALQQLASADDFAEKLA